MSIEKIHKAFVNSRILFFAVVLIFVVVRLSLAGAALTNPAFWGSMLIQIGIALLLLQLNHIFTIIRERTFLPAIFYLFFVGSHIAFSSDISGSIATLCVVLSYLFLFHSYQNPDSQIRALNITLILVLGSLLWSPLLLFLPIFWYGFYYLRSLNFKVFFSCVTGFLIIYLFLFTWGIYVDDGQFFLSYLPNLGELFVLQQPDFNSEEWLVIGFTLIICIGAGFNLFLAGVSEKIRAISILRYLYFSSFIILALLLFQSNYKSQWALIWYIPVAMLTAHFFTLSNKRFVKYLMLFHLVFFLVMGFWNYVTAFIL
jgi:hypothetical protein